MTVITTTFIPCGAKLPVIGMIAAALFGGAWWVAPSAYVVGMAAGVGSGIRLKRTRLFAGDPSPFIMELPAYHWPTAKNLFRATWDRTWSFIKKAGTLILLSAIVVWAGTSMGVVDGKFVFDPELALDQSFLGVFGAAIAWIFIPLGFGNAASALATLLGLLAKEEVVSVFGILGQMDFTPLSGYSFLIFNLLCAPCFAAMGAIRREMNSARWTAFAITYQCVFAYAVSLMIYQFGIFFTVGGNPVGFTAAAAVALVLFIMLARRDRYTKQK